MSPRPAQVRWNRSIPAATKASLPLLLALLLPATVSAAGGSGSGNPGMPGFPPMFGPPPDEDAEGTQTALGITIPSLPAGTEDSYQALPDTASAEDPEQAACEERQRAEDLAADLKTIGTLDDLPEAGSDGFRELRAQALAIVARRFEEARAALEADTLADYTTTVNWRLDFSDGRRPVSPFDRERAANASYTVAYSVTHLNRPRFVTAYAAAVFALDPESALGAGNAASAILASGERMHPRPEDAADLRPFRDDAAVVYRYALASSVEDGRWTPRSLGLLINLGNLYIDMKDAVRARPVLLAARAFAPDSWDAALALAACYELQGRSDLARAVLEDKRLARSAIHAAVVKSSKNLKETEDATKLTPDSPEEAFAPVMEKMDAQEVLTAAEFVDELDQSERNKMRYFVENLPVQGSYTAPRIDYLTQFASVHAINQPAGVKALGEFSERLASYSLSMARSLVKQQEDMLGMLGLGLRANVDLNDLMAHPEKYEDTDVEIDVTGLEQLESRLAEMEKMAGQAERELATGKLTTTLKLGASIDPMLAIFGMNPHDYANPMDVMIQQYNAAVFNRKVNTYNAYFFSVNGRTRRQLHEIATIFQRKLETIGRNQRKELEEFQKKKKEAEARGEDTNTATWKLREHAIHEKYALQHNNAAEIAWNQATQVSAVAYQQKIKPKAERFYYDIVRHVALISDPDVREKKNRHIEQVLHQAVFQSLANVLTGFGSFDYEEDWDCDCDIEALRRQAEAEQAELDAIENERLARSKEAKLRFDSGEIPESSPLFQKLDAYGTDLNIPFIPFLSGRISCARTTVNLGAELPLPGSPKLGYSFTENAFTGATTHGGSLEVGFSEKRGSVSAAATLSLKGSVSMDGQGNVTDYSATAAANLKLGLGPATLSVGAEATYTPQGGLTGDVTAGASTSFSNRFGTSGNVAIEASARRGCSLTAKAEQNLNPFSEKIDKAINEELGAIGEEFPVDTSRTKEVWSGKYTL